MAIASTSQRSQRPAAAWAGASPRCERLPAELTDPAAGVAFAGASRSDINGWLPRRRSQDHRPRAAFNTGFLVAEEYAESIRLYREMTYQDIGMTYDFFVERAAELHTGQGAQPSCCARRWKAWPRV